MIIRDQLKDRIRRLFLDLQGKDELILDLFQYQVENNELFKQFLSSSNRPKAPKSLDELSFLPISFFKSFQIKTGKWSHQLHFESSGTTGAQSSIHLIRDPAWCDEISTMIFNGHYPSEGEYEILGLLPSYLERGNSSLVHMVNMLMKRSQDKPLFYLDNFESLREKLIENKDKHIRTYLFGVSYALLDFAEFYQTDDENLTIIETGGMKGRKKEMIRIELHERLQNSFVGADIHSEYGMTELSSQAYAKGSLFKQAASMHIQMKQVQDPFTNVNTGKTGIINVVDLANIDSIAFIATEDLGRLKPNGEFEVLGRADNTMARGCNLLYV